MMGVVQQAGRVRLDWLLRARAADGGAAGALEREYNESGERRRFIARIDTGGLTFVVISNVAIHCMMRGRPSVAGGVGAALQASHWVLAMLALLQLLMLQRAPAIYFRRRGGLAVANRLVRTGLYLIKALQHRFDVPGQLGRPGGEQTVATVLLFPSVLQLQVSLHFPLPVADGLLLQPLASLMALSWGLCTPPAGGAAVLSCLLCGKLGRYSDTVLFLMTWGMVPPAGRSSPPGTCCAGSGEAVFVEVQVFFVLLISLFLPLFVSHAVELHHKAHYWIRRRCAVDAEWSPLLPLPQSRLLSHALVALLVPVALWLAAEMLAPALLAVRAAVCPAAY